MGRRIVVDALIVVGAIVLGLALSIKPWQGYQEQRRLADRHAAEMRAADKSREDLIRKKAHLESKAGRELAARNQGYTKRGERPADEPN